MRRDLGVMFAATEQARKNLPAFQAKLEARLHKRSGAACPDCEIRHPTPPLAPAPPPEAPPQAASDEPAETIETLVELDDEAEPDEPEGKKRKKAKGE